MEPREEFEASLKHLTRRRFLGQAGAAAAGAVIALRLDMLLDVKAVVEDGEDLRAAHALHQPGQLLLKVSPLLERGRNLRTDPSFELDETILG